MPSSSSATPRVTPPWRQFLAEVDQLLATPVELHCLGGFVITECYGLPRPTSDVDYIAVRPLDAQRYQRRLPVVDPHWQRSTGSISSMSESSISPKTTSSDCWKSIPERFVVFASSRWRCMTSSCQNWRETAPRIARTWSSLSRESHWIRRCCPIATKRNCDLTWQTRSGTTLHSSCGWMLISLLSNPDPRYARDASCEAGARHSAART